MISEVMKAKLFAKIRLILETEFGRDSLMSLRFCFVAITTQSFWEWGLEQFVSLLL